MIAPSRATAFLVVALGIATFSVMDAVMKGLVLALGVYNSMFWRALAGCLLSGALYGQRRSRWPPRASMRMHVLRGVLMAAMALLFFWGLARVPMAQAVAMTFIAPLISIGLAAAVLKERIGGATIVASVIALGGVILILIGRPDTTAGTDAGRGTAAILASAVCYAFNIILMRRQALVADPLEIAFFQNLVLAATLALAAPVLASQPPPAAILPLVAAAALAVGSSLMMAWGYARAEASYLSATEYTAFLWAALFGFIVYGERVQTATIAGAALIVGGCLYAASRRPLPPFANAEAGV